MRTASPAQIRDISVPAARDGVIDPGQRGRASAATHARRTTAGQTGTTVREL